MPSYLATLGYRFIEPTQESEVTGHEAVFRRARRAGDTIIHNATDRTVCCRRMPARNASGGGTDRHVVWRPR
ncbi:MAG TPA: hypothetical protein VHC22_28060 [Pirellulales bacterium]|nr:hypothetical protein [Pirellulales bacterium]